MKDDKFVMRFSSTSYVFYSLTHNQNDKLYVKLTFLFLQCGVEVITKKKHNDHENLHSYDF